MRGRGKQNLKKVKKNYLLSPDTVGKIEQLAAEKKLTYGGVVELLVDAYFENRTKEYKVLMDSMNGLMEQLLHPLLEELNRVRVTSNVIDRNTQMIVEFWNHHFFLNGHKSLGSTDKFKTAPLIEA